MKSKTLQLGKTYKTLEKEKIRIICTDRMNTDGRSVVALSDNIDEEAVRYYFPDGRYLEDSSTSFDICLKK